MALTVCALTLAGCGGDDGDRLSPPDPDPVPAPLGLTVTGSIEGQAAPGSVVEVEGTGLSVVADSRGAFLLADVPAGARALLITDGMMATARVPVTVVAGTTVHPGVHQIDRQAAIAVLTAELLATLPGSDAAAIMASQNLIPAGAIISAESSPTEPRPSLEVLSPSWLFFIDLFPDSAYAHPVVHALVDDVTGELTRIDSFFWPQINSIDMWSSLEERMSDDTIQVPQADSGGSTSIPVAAPVRVTPPVALPSHPECTEGDVYSLFVVGSEETTFTVSAVIVQAELNPAQSRTVAPTLAEDFADVHGAALSDLQPMLQPCDTLVIYVASHGAWCDVGNTSSGAVMYKRTDETLGDDQTQWIFANDILPIPFARSFPACHLIIIVDACFAQSMLGPFETVFDFLPDHVEAIAVASAGAAESAIFAEISLGSELFGTPIGGKFTQELVDFGAVGANPSVMMLSMDLLKDDPNSETRDQKADYSYHPNTAPCTGSPPPPPPPAGQIDYEVDPSTTDFSHFVGSSPCPQFVDTITTTNTGDVPLDVSATAGHSALDASGGGVLNPGQELVVDVHFNCSTTSSFMGSVEIEITPLDPATMMPTGSSIPESVVVTGTIQ